MSATIILGLFLGYFLLLIGVARLTSGKADNLTFFLGNRESPWYMVAFGMIGTSLSGVTFISVPGQVGAAQFSYMQVVLGYFVGYFVIAFVLMPLYYRLNLTSIYTYLEGRFGKMSYKVGAFYFMLSRVIGASFRLYLIANVLQLFVFGRWNIPFEVTVLISILFIWLYTNRGGIRTIIWTDALQTLFMLTAVGVSIVLIGREMNLGVSGLVTMVAENDMSSWFFWGDFKGSRHFLKQFLGGMFITITMTGMDQDMMQKNLSCRNIGEAKKNMLSFSAILVVVNLLFLSLGALLYLYADHIGMSIPEKTDDLYPMVALESGLGMAVGIFFVLGLVSAAYSSADSALTALTTSFCVDVLGIKYQKERQAIRTRRIVHIGMSLLLLVVIVIFNRLTNKSVIHELLSVASYTYGPLLGLFFFGILSSRRVRDKTIPVICILSPVLTWGVDTYSEAWFAGYRFGYELLIVNGAITFLGLFLVSLSTPQRG